MNKISVQDLAVLRGKYVLLHSGYGGGQYVGRVAEVKDPKDAERYLVLLILEEGTRRYQPRGSTGGGRDDICYWRDLPYDGSNKDLELHIKEKDNLFLIGEEPDLKMFERFKRPINPSSRRHAMRLIGEGELKPIYEGSELKVIR